MVPGLRRAFNASFTEERYRALVQDLEGAAGFPVGFRISETPVFLDERLTRELVRGVGEIVDAVTSERYLRQAARAIPPSQAVPGEDAHTTFLQIDFALVRDEDGKVVPRLIELQGFPSLYAFQWLLDQVHREHYVIPAGLSPYFGGLDPDAYVDRLRRVIVGDCDPAQVVLLEIEPESQKTRIDFAATERLLGVRSLDPRQVEEKGGRLFYRDDDGRQVPIRRIYNRVIFDELDRKGLRFDHLFRRELDVRWVGHPNWFWKISKFSLPFIHSRYCPPSWFVSELPEVPGDLESYVLKPLYSFAGLGVEVGVTAERLRAIEDPENWILQRRVEYAPLIETPDVPAKAEVRMMLLWDDEPRPVLVNNLVRMSKGLMAGVDFNKDKTWIGASLAYHPPI
jgi:hypothetical protein